MDFVPVDNLAAATAAALSRGRDRGVYYITDGAPMPLRDFFTPVLATAGADVGRARSVPLAVAAPVAGILDRAWRLLRRPTAPPLNNWLIATMGRDRSYDITNARADLDYRPSVTFAAGLDDLRTSARWLPRRLPFGGTRMVDTHIPDRRVVAGYDHGSDSGSRGFGDAANGVGAGIQPASGASDRGGRPRTRTCPTDVRITRDHRAPHGPAACRPGRERLAGQHLLADLRAR